MKSPIYEILTSDSEILKIDPDNSFSGESIGEELMHATKISLIYRVRKDGKYFLLKRPGLKGERGRKILRREYELSIGCDHTNIVDVYEYRVNPEGNDELIMEYVEGRTLSEFLAESPSHKIKKKIFSELLDAVDYLHHRRIIHNDLKPENILVSRQGDHVKLIDFGLSDDDAHYEIKTPGYTSTYAAPELKEERKSDPRSDIYSLGVIMRQLFGTRYSSVSNKCKKKNPENRFENIKALKRKWKRRQNIFKYIYISTALMAFLASFSVLFFINKYQRDKIDEIQNKLSIQSYELTHQKQQYIVLQKTYEDLKDSIYDVELKARLHEEKKNRVINEYKAKMIKAKNITLDSIKMGFPRNIEGRIRMNYLKAMKSIYEQQPKEVDGEDLKAIMHSMYRQYVDAAYDEFNTFSKEMK